MRDMMVFAWAHVALSTRCGASLSGRVTCDRFVHDSKHDSKQRRRRPRILSFLLVMLVSCFAPGSIHLVDQLLALSSIDLDTIGFGRARLTFIDSFMLMLMLMLIDSD